MVPSGSWVSAPKEAVILGLKELPSSEDPITQRHIFFAHAYKVGCLEKCVMYLQYWLVIVIMLESDSLSL